MREAAFVFQSKLAGLVKWVRVPEPTVTTMDATNIIIRCQTGSVILACVVLATTGGSMAKSESHPAIKALEDEIEAVRKQQQPTRDKINALEAELVEGEAIIRRNLQAVDLLLGKTPVSAGARRARVSGGPTASQINERAIVDFVAGNQPIGASQIGQAVGANGNALSMKLKTMVDSGVLTKQGERRATKYSLKVG